MLLYRETTFNNIQDHVLPFRIGIWRICVSCYKDTNYLLGIRFSAVLVWSHLEGAVEYLHTSPTLNVNEREGERGGCLWSDLRQGGMCGPPTAWGPIGGPLSLFFLARFTWRSRHRMSVFILFVCVCFQSHFSKEQHAKGQCFFSSC